MKTHIKPLGLTQYIIKPTNEMGVIRDVLTAIGVSAGHAAVWPVWPSFSLSANTFVMFPWLSTAFIITLSTLLLAYLIRNIDRGEPPPFFFRTEGFVPWLDVKKGMRTLRTVYLSVPCEPPPRPTLFPLPPPLPPLPPPPPLPKQNTYAFFSGQSALVGVE